MKKQHEAYVLNVASGAGHQEIENLSIYWASKFGTIGLSESMRKELSKFGAQVDYVCPGYVKTNFFKDVSRVHQQMHNDVEPEVIAEEVLGRITQRKGTKKPLKSVEALVEYRELVRPGVNSY